MFGENSSGRKVSLLNEPPPKHSPHQHSTNNHATIHPLPSLSTLTKYSYRPRPGTSQGTSSASTSPETSPSTPPLSRWDSISSVGTQTTPPPMTPVYPFNPLDQSKHGPPYYSTYPRPPNGSTYPAMPQAQDPSGPPYFHLRDSNNRMTDAQVDDVLTGLEPPPFPPQTQYPLPNTDPALAIPPSTALPSAASNSTPTSKPSTRTSSTKPPSNSNTSTTSPTSSKPAKKKYPCPHAVRYSCPDTFTTSGHAARHGKKHTGEKNIHCPTCHKAFTRKDNMKQHERTHKSSTARIENPPPTTPATSNGKPPSASSRQRRPVPRSTGSHSSVASMADAPAIEFDGDSSKLELSFSPGQMTRLPDAMQDVRPTTTSKGGRLPSLSSRSEVDGEGDSPGLDALAHVASEMGG